MIPVSLHLVDMKKYPRRGTKIEDVVTPFADHFIDGPQQVTQSEGL